VTSPDTLCPKSHRIDPSSLTSNDMSRSCLYLDLIWIDPKHVLLVDLLYISVFVLPDLRIRMHCRWSVCTSIDRCYSKTLDPYHFQSVLPLRIHLWWPCKKADQLWTEQRVSWQTRLFWMESRVLIWFEVSDTFKYHPSLLANFNPVHWIRPCERSRWFSQGTTRLYMPWQRGSWINRWK
jgi:hypothetical protein